MIPIAKPIVGEEEIEALKQVIESGQLAHGSKVEKFQKEFAKYIGVKYAVMTSSGTSALYLMLLASGLQPGDKVITTPFTFAATSDVIAWCGAVPVFVDVESDSFNISPKAIEQALVNIPGIRAILVVHLYGLPANMPEICRIADKYCVDVFEDAAQAHGASINGELVGSFGRAGVFSFYPTKNMTCGGGGMIVTNERELAQETAQLANHGQDEPYSHKQLGFNFRSNDLQAAMGIEQLKKLPKLNEMRQANAFEYLKKITNRRVQLPKCPTGFNHAYNLFTIRCAKRNSLLEYLQRRGIGAKVYYPSLLYDQPSYQYIPLVICDCSNALRCSRQVLSLPVHPALSVNNLGIIIDAVNEFRGETF